jgi:hypothetical protein
LSPQTSGQFNEMEQSRSNAFCADAKEIGPVPCRESISVALDHDRRAPGSDADLALRRCDFSSGRTIPILICSHEHERTIGKISAEAHTSCSPSAARVQPMAETSNRLKTVLERIRDHASEALSLLGDSSDQRSLGWKCTGCGQVKHFTRPVPAEVAPPCPKCEGASFEAC